MVKWKSKRTIDEVYAGGGMKRVVVVNADEADEEISKSEYHIEHWRNAALCEKPRGACKSCRTRNCYFKKALVDGM